MGLVGCGTLGRTLGARLLASGHALTVFDRDSHAAELLVAAGAARADSPAELAARSALTISSLPGPHDVEEVALGETGLWAGAAPHTIHIETSTVGPTCVQKLARDAAARGLRFVDAPISRGGIADETEGKDALVAWVGAAPDHFDLARPILHTLAERVVYCGGVGLGQTTKIANNLIAHALVGLVGEALALAVRAGASLDVLRGALHHGTGQNRVLDELFPASVLQGDYRPGLRVDLALKDLDLARELAAEQGMTLESSEPVRRMLEQARERGWSDQSAHVIVRLIEERSGVLLRTLVSDEGGTA